MTFRNSRRPSGSSNIDGLLGELAVQVVEEAGGLRQLVEALPVARLPAFRRRLRAEGSSRATGTAGTLPDRSAHRWQVEQVVWVLIPYFFTSSRPSSSWLAGGFVGDVEDLVLRAHEPLRVAVAVEAPLHLQRVLLPHQRHLVDAAVAGRAAHALVHVGAVVEVDEVRQVVDLGPLDGDVGLEARAHRLEGGALVPDLRVAVHAGLGGRDAGVGRLLHRGVAVAAVDAHAAHVMRVAEGHRLLAGLVGPGDPGRAVHPEEEQHDAADDEEPTEDREPRQGVRAAVEDLGHELTLTAVAAVQSLLRAASIVRPRCAIAATAEKCVQ